MKKIYIQPEATIVSVNLIGTVLEEPSPTGDTYSNVAHEVDAKESAVIEDEEALPTQQSLWGDDEE